MSCRAAHDQALGADHGIHFQPKRLHGRDKNRGRRHTARGDNVSFPQQPRADSILSCSHLTASSLAAERAVLIQCFDYVRGRNAP